MQRQRKFKQYEYKSFLLDKHSNWLSQASFPLYISYVCDHFHMLFVSLFPYVSYIYNNFRSRSYLWTVVYQPAHVAFFLLFASLIPLITAPFVPGWMQPCTTAFHDNGTGHSERHKYWNRKESKRFVGRPSINPPSLTICSHLDHWHIWLIFITTLLTSKFRCSLTLVASCWLVCVLQDCVKLKLRNPN